MHKVELKMENLPRDLIIDIFTRLPISSFMQAKLVCRTWRALVQDQGLLSLYHDLLSERDPCVIVQREELPSKDHLDLYIIEEKDECCSHGNKTRGGKFDTEFSLRDYYVGGSCNGLLCVSDKEYHDRFIVYNPFISGHIIIPKLSTGNPNQKVAFGFGVSPKTREYKIVRISYFEKKQRNQIFADECSDVHVFTLGTQAWRHLGFAPWRLDSRPSEATVNGALHWVTRRYTYEPHHLQIISFDLEKEKFMEIQRPDNCDYLDIHNYHLVVLHGSLSIAAYRDNQIEIWLMKEYNVRKSWTKEFTISTSLHLCGRFDYGFTNYLRRGPIEVLCVLETGEIVLEYENMGLVLYNPGEDYREFARYVIPERINTVVHYPSPFPIDAILQMQGQVNNSVSVNDTNITDLDNSS